MAKIHELVEQVRRWWSPERQLTDAKDQTLIHVALVDRRNYLGGVDADAPDRVQVYLPNKQGLVLEIKPAKGEPRRSPALYQVKVLDQVKWQIRTLTMRAGQPLLIQ